MYKFICDNGHASYSASEEQNDMACPTCGEPAKLVDEDNVVTVKFNEESTHWSQDPDINALFITTVLNYLADTLKAQGYVFLNEVLRELGLPRTSQGQLIGWLYSEKETWWTMDRSTDHAEDEDDIFTLTFYTHGVMYDKIETLNPN
jgi:hypothetical protein